MNADLREILYKIYNYEDIDFDKVLRLDHN
jgi:hypothetical protein